MIVLKNCKKIYDILNKADKETIRVELKRFDVLDLKESKKKFLHEIVAFANRYGGEIVLGINNDGTFEGKSLSDPDAIKGTINNLIFSKISPKIACEIEFFKCKEGDVFLITVPKKTDVPYAYVKKSNDEILYREYIIRTSHGTRHVSDRQLQFLFKEEEIDFMYPFQAVINYEREDLSIPINLKQALVVRRSFSDFLNHLPAQDVNFLLKDNENIINFFLEIAPYILLTNFSHHFFLSWMVEGYDNQFSTSEIPLNVKTTLLTHGSLPNLSKSSIISSLSFDLKNYLSHHGFRNFFVPPETDISIEVNRDERFSKLAFNNKDFIFEFTFAYRPYAWGSGVEKTHPQFNFLLENVSEFSSYSHEKFAHVQFMVIFRVNFNFPESKYELFSEYNNYALNIKRILQEDWDYNYFKEKIPHSIHYENKYILDKIYELLNKKD